VRVSSAHGATGDGLARRAVVPSPVPGAAGVRAADDTLTNRVHLVPRAILVAVALVPVVVAANAGAAGAGAPDYRRTIGGPGHAEMYPSGVDVGPDGTVYIADTGNDQVAAYTAAGARRWRVGRHGARALGVFSNPRDVAFLAGRLYVADTGHNRVQVLDARSGRALSAWRTRFTSVIGISAGRDGRGRAVVLAADDRQNRVTVFTPGGARLRSIAPAPGRGNGRLRAPRDADTDSAGNIYVADYANNRIAKFSPAGAWIRNWGSKGSRPGQFARPYGVAVDGADRVYVADSNNGRIQRFSAAGRYQMSYGRPGAGPGRFFQLRRVAVGTGAAPAVYGADLWGVKVLRFAAGGALQRTFGGRGAPAGRFDEPSGIHVDADLFVADAVNQRIQRFDPRSGRFELAWGHRGWRRNDPQGFNWPRDVTVAGGSVWVADTKNNRLVEFSRAGRATGRRAGRAGAGANELHWPWGIAAHGDDLIVADTFNDRVQRWDTRSLRTTWTRSGFSRPRDVHVAGRSVYVADTGANRIVVLDAASGRRIRTIGGLREPHGVAVDGVGHLWVAATGANRVVELTATGRPVSSFGGLGTAHGRFNHPIGVAVRGGELFVVDQWNDRIDVFAIG
jgi:YVTN family beta-propeller protein